MILKLLLTHADFFFANGGVIEGSEKTAVCRATWAQLMEILFAAGLAVLQLGPEPLRIPVV